MRAINKDGGFWVAAGAYLLSLLWIISTHGDLYKAGLTSNTAINAPWWLPVQQSVLLVNQYTFIVLTYGIAWTFSGFLFIGLKQTMRRSTLRAAITFVFISTASVMMNNGATITFSVVGVLAFTILAIASHEAINYCIDMIDAVENTTSTHTRN